MSEDISSNTSGDGTVLYDRKAVYAALDTLPPALRRFFREAPQNWSPVETAREYRKAVQAGVSEATIVQRFIHFSRMIVAEEISGFAQTHRKEHGYELPHIAAGASLQTYGDTTPFAGTATRNGKRFRARLRNPI